MQVSVVFAVLMSVSHLMNCCISLFFVTSSVAWVCFGDRIGVRVGDGPVPAGLGVIGTCWYEDAEVSVVTAAGIIPRR